MKFYTDDVNPADTFENIVKFLAPSSIGMIIDKDSLFRNYEHSLPFQASALKTIIRYYAWYDPIQKYIGINVSATIPNVPAGDNKLQSLENVKGMYMLLRLEHSRNIKLYHVKDLTLSCGDQFTSAYNVPISEENVKSYPVIPFNKYYYLKL